MKGEVQLCQEIRNRTFLSIAMRCPTHKVTKAALAATSKYMARGKAEIAQVQSYVRDEEEARMAVSSVGWLILH